VLAVNIDLLARTVCGILLVRGALSTRWSQRML